MTYVKHTCSETVARPLTPSSGTQPNPLPADAELLAYRLDRNGLTVEAEAKLEHPPLGLRQHGQRAANLLPPNRLRRLLGRVAGVGVDEQVAQLGVIARAHPLVERDGHLDGVQRLVNVLQRKAGRFGELFPGGLPPELGLKPTVSVRSHRSARCANGGCGGDCS